MYVGLACVVTVGFAATTTVWYVLGFAVLRGGSVMIQRACCTDGCCDCMSLLLELQRIVL